MKTFLHWACFAIRNLYRCLIVLLLWQIGSRILEVDYMTISALQMENQAMRNTMGQAAEAMNNLQRQRDELWTENNNLLMQNPFTPSVPKRPSGP